jgi:hypothetical protein
MEAAAAGRVDRARHLARKDNALAPRAWIGERRCREQRLGIGMKGRPEECVLLRELDDLSEIHDGDPVADVLDHREIMRNEEVGELQLLLQVPQQIDDLRLDGDVERRDGLVEHDEARIEHQSAAMPMRWRWPPENSCG